MKRVINSLLAILIAFVIVIASIPQNAQAVAFDPEVGHETLSVRFWNDEKPDIGFYINASSRYILETVTEPAMGSTFGEWSVMDLLRGMYTGYDYMNYIPKDYFTDYLERINAYVIAKDGELDRNKSTEWSRLTLALSSLGQDIRKVGTPGKYIMLYGYEPSTNNVNTNNMTSSSLSKTNNFSVDEMKYIYYEGINKSTGKPQNKYFLLQPGSYLLTANTSGSYDVTNASGSKLYDGDKVEVKLLPTQVVQVDQPYDFVKKLSTSHRFSYRQGINGPIWEIIAMNTGNYELYDAATVYAPKTPTASQVNDINTIGKMIDYILAKEITQSNGTVGGWALTGRIPDPDITAMALQSLAPYYLSKTLYNATGAKTSYEEFATAVERAVYVCKLIQKANGGYDSWGSINSESIVQVIVALTALEMDPLDKNLQLKRIGQTINWYTDGSNADGVWTNNMIDALLTFWANGSGSSPEVGGFKHVTAGYDGGGGSGTAVNAMATDQALYGLIAYDRFLKGKNNLYDMGDMINGEYRHMKANKHVATFDGNGAGNKSSISSPPYALITIPSPPGNASTWNTAIDGSGASYSAGEQLVMPDKSITLYAQQSTEATSAFAIEKVLKAIDELPSLERVKREHKTRIDRARVLYDRLNGDEQAKITNLSKLVALEGKVNNLLVQYEEELQVETLMQTIDSIKSIKPLSLDYRESIENARITYNLLTAKQRLQVRNIVDLELLEAQLAVLEQEEVEITHQERMDKLDGTFPTKEEQEVKDKIEKLNKDIAELPTIEELTLADREKIRIVRIYYDNLTQEEKLQVKGYEKLLELEAQLLVLSKGALETEDLEDEINSNVFDEIVANGKTLTITSNKTAGKFSVSVPFTTLQTALADTKISTFIIEDVRGVKINVPVKELREQLANVQGAKEVTFNISQYNHELQTFSINLEIIKEDATKEAIQFSKGYLKVTIPYNYYINGKKLDEKVLVKVSDNGEKVAVPHVSHKDAITVNIKQGTTLAFMDEKVLFTDISMIANKDEILYLADRLVIKGKDNGQFAPIEEITRGQFAVMIARALNLQPKQQTSQFKDVEGKWYASEIQALYEAGITSGTSATTFNPEGKLTRQQAASLMARVLAYTEFNVAGVTGNVTYKDSAQIASYAQKDIALLNKLQIMEGNDSGQFMPNANLKRSQMAKILKRTLNIAEMM